MKTHNLFEIVMQLNGKITATGCHDTDQYRLQQLNELGELANLIVNEIHKSLGLCYDDRESVKKIGLASYEILTSLKDYTDDIKENK